MMNYLALLFVLFPSIWAKKHQQIYDLSHPFYEDMPVSDHGVPPEISLVEMDEGHGLRAEHYDMCISEKLGTHITVPSTYLRHNQTFYTVDRIPLNYLVNVPAVIIDPRAIMGESKKLGDIQRSLRLNMTHINLWERQHGRIPRGSFVILRTGWSHFYETRDKFFGYFTDEPQQVFPEFGLDAVEWLLEHRSVVGLGTECPDIELRQEGAVKLLLAMRGHFSVVQLTNVDELPMRGLSVTMAPLKLKRGSGGPTRVFAFIEKHHHSHQKNELQQASVPPVCSRDYAKIKRDQPPQAYSSAMSFALTSILLTFSITINYCK